MIETTGIHVLHVDDEPDFAELVADMLEREDDRFTVETAPSGREGLDRLAADDFDCIVSDYDMPGQNGIEFLESIREENPDLPFILYTGKGSEEVASDAISAGVTDYLQKGGGTDQYELLANRIQNAVEQYRAQQRAAEFDRIRTLATDINQALFRADSRSEAETRVCEIISDAAPYLFAWIGEVDSDTNRIEPRAWAGVEESYLNDITVTADETATGRGPSGTALRERRLAVSQNVQEDPEFEPWREEALERGYLATAAVPLEHEDTLYGELAVYADRPHAFDEDERELLSELGNDIAYAIHSLELQAELREERKFIDQALDALDDLFYVVGTDGALRRWNERLSEVTGHTDEELADTQATDIFPADEQETIAGGIEKALTAGVVVVEAELLTKDGERIPYEFTGSRLTDTDGDVIGLIGIGRDITERKKQERKREQIIDRVTDAIVEVNSDWEFTLVNEQAETLYGMDEEHLLGRSFWDVFTEAEGTRFEAEYRDVMETREPTSFTEYYSGLDDWYDIEVFPKDDGGVAFYFHEVSERVERSRELERRDERFQYVEEVADIGYWEIDAQGPEPHDVTLSDGVYHVHDLSPDDPFDVERGLQFYHPEDRSTVEQAVERAISNGEPYDHEVRLITASDRERWVHLVGEPVERDGEVVKVRGVFQDITERKQKELELARQNERLDKFASIVSHDLRNPLSVAQGRLTLAQDECDTENHDAIAIALDRMQRIIEDLLWLAREGKDIGSVEPVTLGDAIESAWEMVSDQTADAEIRYANEESQLPTIEADYDRVCQLLENLYKNAVEHGGDDVTITVGTLADGFYIEDDGPGIPEQERDDVFDPGYSTTEDGTGFGLSIVKQVVEAHDWKIRVTDGSEGGARFEITGVEFVAE